MPATKIIRPMTTRAWLNKIPQAYRDAFYENLADIRTHELWEWIIDLIPLREAEDLMVNLTKHWEEDEVGTPYRRSMKR